MIPGIKAGWQAIQTIRLVIIIVGWMGSPNNFATILALQLAVCHFNKESTMTSSPRSFQAKRIYSHSHLISFNQQHLMHKTKLEGVVLWPALSFIVSLTLKLWKWQPQHFSLHTNVLKMAIDQVGDICTHIHTVPPLLTDPQIILL